MAVRLLADKHIKLTVLTAEPANPAAPTAAELNAGIEASCLVLYDNFKWTAADSEKVGEQALCEDSKSEVPGVGNYDLGFTAWRWFDPETKEVDPTADVLFEAVKEKGTTLWGYVRRTGKEYSEAWASGDEIQLGGSFVTDTPQVPDGSGFIKYDIPASSGKMHDFIKVASA